MKEHASVFRGSPEVGGNHEQNAIDKSSARVRPQGVRSPDPLAVLYDAHAPALFRFLIRLTGDEAAVKDILQEIFLRLAREPGLLRDVAAPRSYLFRMAHRLAIDQARREETRLRYAERAGAGKEIAAVPAASESDAAWRREKLAGALAALPPEQRAVVLLKVWEGLTFAEIGKALEISPDTAASRHRYALDKLRDALRPLHEDLL
jgi:RNA polymerase sigma-70 factor (ECF subfamily)